MIGFKKDKDKAVLTDVPEAESVPTRNMAAMTRRLGLNTVPAAWPTGVSQLAIAVATCQRCSAGEVCSDWLLRAPKTIEVPPPFCPNAPEFTRAKKAKGQG